MNRVFPALALTFAVALTPAAAFAQKPSLKNPASLNEKGFGLYEPGDSSVWTRRRDQ